MTKKTVGSVIAFALLVCIALCVGGCEKTASSAEKRFAEVFADAASLPAGYFDRRIDGEPEKLVIVVTDDRASVKQRYVELLGEEYADLIVLEKHELSDAELGSLIDEIGSYLKARGFKYNAFSKSEGNIIHFGVNEANREACNLADEISESFGVHVIIEIMGDIELLSDGD